jgi:uncharacterized protein (TIGR02118 family)
MLKLSILMVRRSGFTYENFLKYWREVHAPLFSAQLEAKKYAVRRYVQDHRTVNTLPGTTPSNFDGIAEIWFDDTPGPRHSSGRTATRRM